MTTQSNDKGTTASIRVRLIWLLTGLLIIAAGIAVGRWAQMRHAAQVAKTAAQQAAAKAVANEETVWRTRLGMDALPPGRLAPNFTLTDERGQTVSLAGLKGKVVVLQFMDPQCTDICPIVSQELVLADQHLGAKASEVVFLGINVNQYHEKPAELMTFSGAHGLTKLPNWYFLTGTTDQLKKVWQDYGIYVEPNKTGDVVHSSYFYFIDKTGTERYLAPATNAKTTISEWGQGIALFSGKLI